MIAARERSPRPRNTQPPPWATKRPTRWPSGCGAAWGGPALAPPRVASTPRCLGASRRMATLSSGHQKAVQVAQHPSGGAPNEVAPRPAFLVLPVPGNRQEFAPHACELELMAAVVRGV